MSSRVAIFALLLLHLAVHPLAHSSVPPPLPAGQHVKAPADANAGGHASPVCALCRGGSELVVPAVAPVPAVALPAGERLTAAAETSPAGGSSAARPARAPPLA